MCVYKLHTCWKAVFFSIFLAKISQCERTDFLWNMANQCVWHLCNLSSPSYDGLKWCKVCVVHNIQFFYASKLAQITAPQVIFLVIWEIYIACNMYGDRNKLDEETQNLTGGDKEDLGVFFRDAMRKFTFQLASVSFINANPFFTSAFISFMWAIVWTDQASVWSIAKACEWKRENVMNLTNLQINIFIIADIEASDSYLLAAR